MHPEECEMKNFKTRPSGIIFCLFEIVIGILLLISPVGFTTGIICALGIALMAAGIMSIVQYIKANPKEAEKGQYLTKGLLALLVGCFCAIKSHWFIVTFPALSILYGVGVLVAGLAKVQFAFDMIRQRNKKWFLGFISAAVSIICAVVILKNPFTSAEILWMFTSISLIVEAVFDAVALIMSRKA